MKQILTRLALTVPVVWLVVSLVFLLIHLVPGDLIQQMLGEGATPADIAALRHQYALDLPLHTQYLRYWSGVLHGGLGNSIRRLPAVNWINLCAGKPANRRSLPLGQSADTRVTSRNSLMQLTVRRRKNLS